MRFRYTLLVLLLFGCAKEGNRTVWFSIVNQTPFAELKDILMLVFQEELLERGYFIDPNSKFKIKIIIKEYSLKPYVWDYSKGEVNVYKQEEKIEVIKDGEIFYFCESLLISSLQEEKEGFFTISEKLIEKIFFKIFKNHY